MGEFGCGTSALTARHKKTRLNPSKTLIIIRALDARVLVLKWKIKRVATKYIATDFAD